MVRTAVLPPLLTIAISLFAPLASSQAPPQLPEQYRPTSSAIQSLSSRLAARLKHQPRRRIAVLDFLAPSAQDPRFASWLADQTAASLAGSSDLQIIDCARVRAVIERESLQLDDFDSLKNLNRLASELEADILIRGWFVPQSRGLSLTLSAVAFKPKLRHAGEAYSFVPISPDLEAHAGPPLVDPKIAQLPRVVPGSGLSYPQCTYCPNPPFTDDARTVKFNGSLLLELTITPAGRAADIEILRYAGYGLEQQVIRTVQSWRFTPSRDGAGNPVAVRVPVEVNLGVL